MTEIYDRDLREIFPDYICFGLLDLDSLCIVCPIDKENEDYAHAIYRSKKGDLVYDIKDHGKPGQQADVVAPFWIQRFLWPKNSSQR